VRSLGIFIKAGLALWLVYGVALGRYVKYAATLEPDTGGGSGKGTAALSLIPRPRRWPIRSTIQACRRRQQWRRF